MNNIAENCSCIFCIHAIPGANSYIQDGDFNMIPGESAGKQMLKAYGKYCNGVETIPFVTVLTKPLLEKFGVEVPENLMGKPIILSDGSGASYTADCFHLGECGLDQKRTLQVMAKAQENLLEMVSQQSSFEQGEAFVKVFAAALDQNQKFAGKNIQIAAAGPVAILENEEGKNSGKFEFRQKDAKPQTRTHTDDITHIVNTLANSKKDGNLEIESVRNPGTFYKIHKDGDRISFALNSNNTFAFKFEKNADNSVTLSEIKSSGPPGPLKVDVSEYLKGVELSIPKSIRMWTTPAGEFQFEAKHQRGSEGIQIESHRSLFLRGSSIERE